MCIFRSFFTQKSKEVTNEPPKQEYTKEEIQRQFLEACNDEYNYGHNVEHPYIPEYPEY